MPREEKVKSPIKKRTMVRKKRTGSTTVKEYAVGSIDMPFLLYSMLLLMIGLVMVFSAGHAQALDTYNDSYYYIRKQLIFAVIGVVAMIIASKIDYKFFRKMALPLYIVSVILLVLVLIMGIELNGSKRWLSLGFTTIQPSEIAKLAIILMFAQLISVNYNKMHTFKKGIWPFLLLLMLVCGLILLQTHFSATLMICMVAAVLLIVGGANLKVFAAVGGIGAAGIFILIFFTDYAKARLDTWLNPFADALGKGYQIINSLYAIGSGGLMGLGLGKSRQKYLYLSEAQNDFIFSIVAEELGFIGCLLILTLFVCLIYRGYKIAVRCPDKFSSLVVIGIVSNIAIQTILNLAVVTNFMPVTGVSLPFFSAGGTALVLLLGQIGMILSISRYSHIEKE